MATFALTITTDHVRANHTAPTTHTVSGSQTITPGDGTPLTRAVALGNTELAAALLAQGADINQPVPLEGSALIVATKSDHPAMIGFLLAKGAEVNQVVAGDETALITASRLDRVSIARQLIAAGADINLGVNAETTGGKVWRTPLNQANSQTMRALLIDAGAREDGPTLRYR
ncbi:ankyrin repeat domain-containing protein [Alteromonas salexigens]|uniref:ankyrin repeat domain-containing protein n=1 Tax=Alteromonas salexigens TaxID=2982530 RepID=UPI0021D5B356|nr:ankyrin repeat domain-containing protein [Alteromonas salexigens]